MGFLLYGLQPKPGKLALSGQLEHTMIWTFDPADKDRWLRGRGSFIMVYDPATSQHTHPTGNWRWDDRNKISPWVLVPKGHMIRVHNAWVEMSE
ncbi:hypothetical protein VTJ04DRAFT_6907 [Mycothermus thermophilus]|uniref:uncharacterized protein n=1 Tax=Humicola insolens TaxID=85995 RepID=UPI0037421951